MKVRSAPERSRELFESGWYCAESVLKAVAEQQGIDHELIPGIASGFCSGMARTCGECGAMTGAIMALGMVQGRREPDAERERLYANVQGVIAQFKEQYGSTNCQQLTGVDLGTEVGQATFREEGKFSDCLNYVETATRLVVEALADAQ